MILLPVPYGQMNPLCPEDGGRRNTWYVGTFIPDDATSNYRMHKFFIDIPFPRTVTF
jgi:hypothetical protein